LQVRQPWQGQQPSSQEPQPSQAQRPSSQVQQPSSLVPQPSQAQRLSSLERLFSRVRPSWPKPLLQLPFKFSLIKWKEHCLQAAMPLQRSNSPF
jgi:hypothetical protein